MPLEPPSPETRRRMVGQRRIDTGPELELRRRLHAEGLRFRVHRKLLPGSRRTVDIVFGPARVAVDVRGCFWHGCPEHFALPKNNQAWWLAKIEANRRRDAATVDELRAAGWQVIVVWEHEDAATASERIIRDVKARRHG